MRFLFKKSTEEKQQKNQPSFTKDEILAGIVKHSIWLRTQPELGVIKFRNTLIAGLNDTDNPINKKTYKPAIKNAVAEVQRELGYPLYKQIENTKIISKTISNNLPEFISKLDENSKTNAIMWISNLHETSENIIALQEEKDRIKTENERDLKSESAFVSPWQW